MQVKGICWAAEAGTRGVHSGSGQGSAKRGQKVAESNAARSGNKAGSREQGRIQVGCITVAGWGAGQSGQSGQSITIKASAVGTPREGVAPLGMQQQPGS